MSLIYSTLINKYLEEVAEILILNGTLITDPGLLFGKTGIAVFFFHYARYTGNELFEDYAMELIEAAREQIHVSSPADYARGIAGIGVGVDHLIRNAFIEPDEDIFADFDQRMYRAVMYEPHLVFDLCDGIVGYGRYWLKRHGNPDVDKQVREAISFILESISENMEKIADKERPDVYFFLESLIHWSEYSYRAEDLIEKLKRVWNITINEDDRTNNPEKLNMSDIVSAYRLRKIDVEQKGFLDEIIKYLEKPVSSVGMDLFKGYAGLGLLLMSDKDACNTSWMELL